MSSSRRSFIKQLSFGMLSMSMAKYSFGNSPRDLTFLSISELSELIRQKKVSPVEIVRACLERIESLNPKINAFITVTVNEAMEEARKAENEIRNGKWKGPLHGIPIAYKDNIDTAGIKTTAASGVYKDRIPNEDAEVVKKLKKAGAISLGKLNMHEFALGTTSVVSYYGAVHNPWNTEFIAGGSSGGSAAAIAAGLCYASIGTDTGGSCRLPPACCGITGFKATYDLISIKGIIPAIRSFDHACPICRTPEDAAILLNAIADTTSQHAKYLMKDYRSSFGRLKVPRVAIATNYKASPEIDSIFKDAINVLSSSGCKISRAELPSEPDSLAIVNLELNELHSVLITSYKDLYDPATLEDLSQLKPVDPKEYLIAIKKLNEDRLKISKKLFEDCDVIITPTLATSVITIEEAHKGGPFALDSSNTEPLNYFGLPAMSIPCGFDKNGLPIGLQIIGPRLGEGKILDIANRYERISKWSHKHPVSL